MFLYMFLPFVFQFVFRSSNCLNSNYPSGPHQSIPVVFHEVSSNIPHGQYIEGGEWNWIWSMNDTQTKEVVPSDENELLGGGYEYKKPEENEVDFDKPSNSFIGLEILKSIDYKFDPETQAYKPVEDVMSKNQSQNTEAEKKSLMLLSLNTYRKLQHIFERLDVEEKKSGVKVRDGKNFQTGRFKYKFGKI